MGSVLVGSALAVQANGPQVLLSISHPTTSRMQLHRRARLTPSSRCLLFSCLLNFMGSKLLNRKAPCK